MKKQKNLGILEIDLEKNDDIYEKLENIQKKYKIKSAFYTGIGAGKDVIVGYLLKTNPNIYKELKCEGDYEITSFIGNIKNGKYHTHITLGNDIANTTSGHFISGKVGFVLQIHMTILEYQ